MSDENDLIQVKENPRHILKVENQTPELCLAAVKSKAFALQLIKNQTPELCLAAVKIKGQSIKYIHPEIPNKLDLNNPAHQHLYHIGWRDGDLEKIYLAAVKRDALALQFIIENQTEEMCLIAVSFLGYTLDYVQNKTHQVCLKALSTSAYALKYIPEQTPELCMIAVKKDGRACRFIHPEIPNQFDLTNPEHIKFHQLGWRDGDLENILLTAVSRHIEALNFIPDHTPTIALAAVNKDVNAIKILKYQSPEISLIAVNKNGNLLRYVNNQSPEICLEAIHNTFEAIEHVKDLQSIAHLIDESVVQQGLNSNFFIWVDCFNIVVKLREAQKITDKINLTIDQKQSITKKRINL